MTNKIIQKVYYNKCNNQKLITVPKHCDIEKGDYVQLIKVSFKESD